MGSFVDLTGQRLGRWVVMSRAPNAGRHTKWLCRCSCAAGTIREVSSDHLRSGRSQSCGCLTVETTIARSTKHGKATKERSSRAYNSWASMLSRCTNPRAQGYRNYGGRGIRVCESWLHSFSQFFADMGREPEIGESLERKDNNGDYCPDNCIWADRATHSKNRRNNRIETYNGKTCTLKEHCEDAQMDYGLVSDRLNKHGWSIEDALTVPRYGKYGNTKRILCSTNKVIENQSPL